VQILRPRYDRAKHQIPLARVGPGGEFRFEADFTFSIFLDEFNGVRPGPIAGVLNGIASEVERVLVATEAECRRIGLLN
jgi:hypothetical protein